MGEAGKEELVSNPTQDEEQLIQDFIEQKQKMKFLDAHSARGQQNDNFIPSTPVESAKSLLDKTSTTQDIKEVDKEHKLANFEKSDKDAVFLHTELWGTNQYLKEKVLKATLEYSLKTGIRTDLAENEQITNEHQLQKHLKMEMINRGYVTRQEHQDETGAFNKSFFISTLTKGMKGWERANQNTTISHHTIGRADKSEEKVNAFGRVMGRR